MWLALLPIALSAELTLDEVLRLGLAESPSAAAIEAQRQLSVSTARGSVLNNPSAEVERVATDTEARLSLPLPVALPSRANAAKASSEAANASFDADVAALAGALGQAYIALARAEELDALAERNAALNARLAEGARRRLEAGEISATEATITQSLAASQGVAALRAEQERLAAAATLEALLNLDPGGQTRSGGWPELSAPNAAPPENPWVLAAQSQASAARSSARAVALASLSPSASLGALSSPHGSGWIVGLNLALPLSAPAQIRAANAQADLAMASAERAQAEQGASLAVAQARAEAAEAAWAMARAPDLDAVPAALAAAFEAGELSLTDYAAQQQLVNQALVARAELHAELELAKLALWTSSGRVPELP